MSKTVVLQDELQRKFRQLSLWYLSGLEQQALSVTRFMQAEFSNTVVDPGFPVYGDPRGETFLGKDMPRKRKKENHSGSE